MRPLTAIKRALDAVVGPFDAPSLLGRTPRELILLAGGATMLVIELARPRIYWPNLLLYVLATVVAAVRFFPARGLAVATCISALIQHWSTLRLGDGRALPSLAYVPLVVLPLLVSDDLVQRYDRAPGYSWLRNPWARLSANDARLLRWCIYALGSLIGMLSMVAMARRHDFLPDRGGGSTWMVLMVCIVLSLTALGLGRTVALLGVAPLAVVILALTVPLMPHAESAMDAGARHAGALGYFSGFPHFVLPIVACSLVALMVAAPSVAGFVRLVTQVRGARTRADD